MLDWAGCCRWFCVTRQRAVTWNVTAVDRCELQARARLIGDLKASRIVIEDGATFIGNAEDSPNLKGGEYTLQRYARKPCKLGLPLASLLARSDIAIPTLAFEVSPRP